MYKFLFATVTVAALAFTPTQAKASWLSRAVGVYFDRGYTSNYGYPGYYWPAEIPTYSYPPAYGYAPWPGYYIVEPAVPYRTYPYNPRYYRSGDGEPWRWQGNPWRGNGWYRYRR